MKIVEQLTQIMGKATLNISANSPKILLVTGIVTGIGAVVSAVISTTKAIPVIEEQQAKIDDFKNQAATLEEIVDEHTEGTAIRLSNDKKALAGVYIRAFAAVAKCYIAPVLLLAASVGCMLGSHHILAGRTAAYAAAYAGLNETFNAYRDRVRDLMGEDLEERIYYGDSETEVFADVTDEKTGEVKHEHRKFKTPTTNNKQLFFFDKYRSDGTINKNYVGDNNCDMTFLCGIESYMNDKLKARGYLFLNDVLRALDICTVKEGWDLGWTYDPDDPNCQCHIDFHIRKDMSLEALESNAHSEEAFVITLITDGLIKERVYENKKGRYSI